MPEGHVRKGRAGRHVKFGLLDALPVTSRPCSQTGLATTDPVGSWPSLVQEPLVYSVSVVCFHLSLDPRLPLIRKNGGTERTEAQSAEKPVGQGL